MAATHELFGRMRADESGAAGHEIRSHEVESIAQLRKAGARQAGIELQRVGVVQLLQHSVRQRHPVQLPEGVVVTVIVEVFVGGLERAPVVRIFVGLIAVLAEQQPVLVLDEEVVRRARLTAEVVEHGADFGVDVRHLVEHRAEPAEVVGVPAQVRQDERRLRVLRDHPVALPHQLFERRKSRPVLVTAVRIQRQLEPALVADSRAAGRTRPGRRCG